MAVKTCHACGSIVGATGPTHTHLCTGGDNDPPHQWQCDSPYCASRERDCEKHGGDRPRKE